MVWQADRPKAAIKASIIVSVRITTPCSSIKNRYCCTGILIYFPYIHKMSRDCGGGGHRRAHQMSTPRGTLPALKVAIGSGSAPFAGLQPVVIHRQAHRATRFAPFKARIAEYPVQPLLLCLML